MRGQILGVENGEGLLLGPQGERRRFPLSEWRSSGAPAPGAWVDYLAEGEGDAHAVYAIAAAPPATRGGSSSFTLGASGVACLVLGLIIPVLPTLAALVLGLIGAARAHEEHDQTGLALSRVAWIGALIMLGVGALAIMAIFVLFGGMIGSWMWGAPWHAPIPT